MEIEFSEEQLEQLGKAAKVYGMTREEIVGRAVSNYIEQYHPQWTFKTKEERVNYEMWRLAEAQREARRGEVMMSKGLDRQPLARIAVDFGDEK